MSSLRPFCSMLVVAGLAVPASGAIFIRHVHRAPQHTHHLPQLNQAMSELQHAKASLNAKNGGAASQHVATAIQHTETAIQLHHTHHLSKPRTGVTGALAQGLHHHHHSHLQQAVAGMKVAEKQIAAGNHAGAVKDLDRAEQQLKQAVVFHHHVIGR